MKSKLIINAQAGTIDRLMPNGQLRRGVGTLGSAGYWQVWADGTMWLVHRLVWESMFGQIPSDMQIDHINGARQDNRIENLRLVTRQQNAQNRRAPRRGSRSGVKGVVWDEQTGKWKAKVMSDGAVHYMGSHETVESAQQAYARGAAEFHTHNPSARVA